MSITFSNSSTTNITITISINTASTACRVAPCRCCPLRPHRCTGQPASMRPTPARWLLRLLPPLACVIRRAHPPLPGPGTPRPRAGHPMRSPWLPCRLVDRLWRCVAPTRRPRTAHRTTTAAASPTTTFQGTTQAHRRLATLKDPSTAAFTVERPVKICQAKLSFCDADPSTFSFLSPRHNHNKLSTPTEDRPAVGPSVRRRCAML